LDSINTVAVEQLRIKLVVGKLNLQDVK